MLESSDIFARCLEPIVHSLFLGRFSEEHKKSTDAA
jgi:hypothetical protein